MRHPVSRLRAAALLGLLAAAGPAAAAFEGGGTAEFTAPLRPGALARAGLASLRASDGESGTPADAFDGRTGTVFRTRHENPAFIEASFDEPREILSADAWFGGDAPHEWSLLAGDGPGRMSVVFERRRVDPGAWSRVEKLGGPVRARCFRVVVLRLDGGDSVSFGEISLQARQRPRILEVAAPSNVACPDGDLVVRARVLWDGGYRSDSAPGLWFEIPQYGPVRRENAPVGGPPTARLRYETAGVSEVRARIGSKNGGMASAPFPIEARIRGLPDWCVGWIERTPRLEFDGDGGGLPAHGDAVVWRAHVKNYGTANADRIPFRWHLDGSPVGDGFVENLQRFEETVVEIRLPWDGARHEVKFTIDPANSVEESSERNNSRAVATDALLLGLWAERPFADRLHRIQAAYGDGANSFEDWAQRQVSHVNQLLAGAVHPLTPKGCADRVALDRVVIVEEGELPLGDGLPTSDPDARDRTLDLQRGFPASLLDDGSFSGPAPRGADDPGWILRSLPRDLARTRYLADLSRLSVRRDEVLLDGPDGAPLAGSPYLAERDRGLLHRSPHAGLAGGSAALTEHEAFALQRVAGRRARGGNREPPPTSGEYLGDLPLSFGIRLRDSEGAGVDGARVRAWRRSIVDGFGEAFAGEPVRQGTTVDGGWLEIARDGTDPFFEGARGEGLDPGQGVLLLEIVRDGIPVYRFLEVVPFNLAFWRGARDSHVEELRIE